MQWDPYKPPEVGDTLAPESNSNLATLSLVFGASSLVLFVPTLCCCFFIFVEMPAAIAAVILGVAALRQIRDGRATGKNLAVAGIVCGGLTILGFVLWMIAYIVLIAVDQSTGGTSLPFEFGVEELETN